MTDINRKRGDTYADQFTIRDSSGAPVDLTGYTFLMTLDVSATPDTAANNLYQLTGTIVDAAAGQVEFAPDEAHADLVGSFFYDVQMTDGAGRIRTIASGKYKYTQDITKD